MPLEGFEVGSPIRTPRGKRHGCRDWSVRLHQSLSSSVQRPLTLFADLVRPHTRPATAPATAPAICSPEHQRLGFGTVCPSTPEPSAAQCRHSCLKDETHVAPDIQRYRSRKVEPQACISGFASRRCSRVGPHEGSVDNFKAL
jgi:hypothetical protein